MNNFVTSNSEEPHMVACVRNLQMRKPQPRYFTLSFYQVPTQWSNGEEVLENKERLKTMLYFKFKMHYSL